VKQQLHTILQLLMADYRSNQVITLGDGAERLRLPIYYLEVELAYYKAKSWRKIDTWVVAYYKAKSWRKIDTWVVTYVEDQNRILKDDLKSNSRLNEELYGSKFKGQRGLRIDRVHTKRRIGTTNW